MKKLTIALVGHDNRKAEMVEWAVHNFLIDDLNPQPHEADIQMLLRQCRVHNVPIACNRYSADLMITSTLWDDDTYFPTEPKYVHFNRE